MKVETGIIAAAGSGTRMLPVSLGYPKELLPIINKPAIQLILEEYLESGIRRIIIVTGANAEPLYRQYSLNDLPERGKHASLDEFVDKMRKVEIIFEPQQGPYGNGTPLMVAGPHIPEGEGFIYAYGDDIIKSSKPFTQQLIETHRATGALVAGTQEVAWEEVVRYGIAQVKEGASDRQIEEIIEKPAREEAKSNLAVFGRFLLSTDIIRILKETPLGKANELWLTDALRSYIKGGGRIVAKPIEDGEWLTIGDPVNYLKTVIEYSLSDPELRAALGPRIRKLLG
jgi:UTP--glucose-1-phosphate uridylyltransferase